MKKLLIILWGLVLPYLGFSQLLVNNVSSAEALVNELLGSGVTVSNIQYTGNLNMTGTFINSRLTNIQLNKGIVLTNGLALSQGNTLGVNGPSVRLASNSFGLPGDAQLSSIAGIPTNDAFILEFDFIPLGDSIKFRYVFSSEEYPEYACESFNDAFAFFITGPGYSTPKNIALIPGSTLPVTINNINNQACGLFPQYYVANANNNYFSHNGHTTVFVAEALVQPCKTYHLKLVIADAGDDEYDSGVFLEAGSLSSNNPTFKNVEQINHQGVSYLAEGCKTSSFKITTTTPLPAPKEFILSYGGTAIVGVDVDELPSSATLPAFATSVEIPIRAIQDFLEEQDEELIVYLMGGCSGTDKIDSIQILIRDFDYLQVNPTHEVVCRNADIQLEASEGYDTYHWTPTIGLNNASIRQPIARVGSTDITYQVSAQYGNCNAKDSIVLTTRKMSVKDKTDVVCKDGTNGKIEMVISTEWQANSTYSIDGVNWQSSPLFENLASGVYWVKVRDEKCEDSIRVELQLINPELQITSVDLSAASCSGQADGQLSLNAQGGNGIYSYSIDGVSFQNSNSFLLTANTYHPIVKDGNGCTATVEAVVPLNNDLTITIPTQIDICEGSSTTLTAQTNAEKFLWTSQATILSNPNLLAVDIAPSTHAWYKLTVNTGVCTLEDSSYVFVKLAPLAYAGEDISICVGGIAQLSGSGGNSFEWSPTDYFLTDIAIADPKVNPTTTTSYYLTVTDVEGCKSLLPDEVVVMVTPAVKLFAGNDTIAAIGIPIQLSVVQLEENNVVRYVWEPASLFDNAQIANPIANLSSTQQLTVTGYTDEGCYGSDQVLVNVYQGPAIYIPTAFSPNGDGLNDVFKFVHPAIQEINYFKIFNRWGKLIYASKETSKGWDGTLNGKPQPEDIYVWMIEGVDVFGNVITKKGTVTLIR